MQPDTVPESKTLEGGGDSFTGTNRCVRSLTRFDQPGVAATLLTFRDLTDLCSFGARNDLRGASQDYGVNLCIDAAVTKDGQAVCYGEAFCIAATRAPAWAHLVLPFARRIDWVLPRSQHRLGGGRLGPRESYP